MLRQQFSKPRRLARELLYSRRWVGKVGEKERGKMHGHVITVLLILKLYSVSVTAYRSLLDPPHSPLFKDPFFKVL